MSKYIGNVMKRKKLNFYNNTFFISFSYLQDSPTSKG